MIWRSPPMNHLFRRHRGEVDAIADKGRGLGGPVRSV